MGRGLKLPVNKRMGGSDLSGSRVSISKVVDGRFEGHFRKSKFESQEVKAGIM